MDNGGGLTKGVFINNNGQFSKKGQETGIGDHALVNRNNGQVAGIVNNQKPTILLVEDNLELQDYIRLILKEKYNVITAENGQAALNCLLKTANCKLVISDLMMPVMDGYQLLEKLKANDATRHIPVIMLTARADAKDKLKALRLGVDDYLLKPFEEEELLARIDNLLKNYQIRNNIKNTLGQDIITTHEPSFELVNGTAQLNVEMASAPILLTAEDTEWLAELEGNLQKELTKFNFKLEHLAETMYVSRRQLGRQVKALTGLTPSEYVLEARLQSARRLLDQKQVKTVKEAAYTVGLRDAKHFSRQFNSTLAL